MKFSAFTIMTADWTVEETAQQLKRLGLDGVAWRVVDQQMSDTPSSHVGNRSTWPLTGLESRLPEMAQLRDETGLEIAALYGYAGWSDHHTVERLVRACSVLKVKTCRVLAPRLPQLGRVPYDEHLQRSKEDWTWIAECARGFGVRVVTPLHHGWVNASASAARRMLDGLPPNDVGIIVDWGCLAREGWEDPLATVQILGPYLDSVMLKNYGIYPSRKRGDGSVIWEHRPEPLQTGRVDIPNVFAALNADGFDGWVTLAEITAKMTTRDRVADALAFAKAAAQSTKDARAEAWIYDGALVGGRWGRLSPGEAL